MRGLTLMTAVLLGAIAIAPTSALTVCPDGKTFSGACVKPELGESLRKQVFVATQPKISYTAPPVLPSEDGSYGIPRDYHELSAIYGVGTFIRPAVIPPACVPSRTNPC